MGFCGVEVLDMMLVFLIVIDFEGEFCLLEKIFLFVGFGVSLGESIFFICILELFGFLFVNIMLFIEFCEFLDDNEI